MDAQQLGDGDAADVGVDVAGPTHPPPTMASILAVVGFVTLTTMSVGAGRISVAYCEPRRSMVTPRSTTEMRPMAPVSASVCVCEREVDGRASKVLSE